MKTIKILIAASEELHAEKLEFTSLVEHLNQVLKPRGIELKRIKWDPEKDGSIDDYLAKLRDCEMCLNLYWRNLSGNSEEELNTAYQQLKEGNNPRNLYVFFKEPTNDLSEALRDFKANFVTNYGHFFCKFENVDTMNLHFILQFEAYQNRLDDSEGKLFKVCDGKVWLGDQDLVELANVSFIAMNKEYRKLHDQISELRVKYAEIRGKHKMNPDDERIENEYLALNTKLNEATNEFEAYQQSLCDMELSFIEHSYELCSDRMIKARELFEQGDSVAADEMLNLEEIEREDFNDEKLHNQILRKREQKIMEYVAKAKMVKLNRNYGYNEQIAIVCKVYNRAIGIAKEINYDEGKLVNILIDCASYLKEKLENNEAIPYYEDALKIQKKLYDENPETHLSELVDTLENLAECRKHAGFYKSAERCYREELKIFRLFAKDDPKTYLPEVAAVLVILGHFYLLVHNSSEAGKCLNEGLRIYNKLSAIDPDTYTCCIASTYKSLSYYYDSCGLYEEAVRSIFFSIEIYKNLNHKRSNAHLESLADCQERYYKLLCRDGISEKAEKAFNEALMTCDRLVMREKYCWSRRDFLLEYHGLSLSEEGRYEDAEKIFRKALRLLCKNKYSQDLDLISIRKEELADQLAHMGKITAAGKCYMEAIDAKLSYEETQMYDSYDGYLGIDKILEKYSNLLVESGHFEKAEKVYLEILGKGVRSRLRRYPYYFMSLSVVLLIDLSELQHRCGDTKKSEKAYKKAIKISQKLVNKIDYSDAKDIFPFVEMVLKYIAGRQSELGLDEEVLKTIRNLVEIKRSVNDYGSLSAPLYKDMDDLAFLYKDNGSFEEAKKLYLEALKIIKNEVDDPFVFIRTEIDILCELANLYRDFGYYKESEENYIQILEKNIWFKEEANNIYTSNEAPILKNYALLKQKQGHYSEAKQLLNQALIDYEQVKEMNYDYYKDIIAETQKQIEEIEEKLKAENS